MKASEILPKNGQVIFLFLLPILNCLYLIFRRFQDVPHSIDKIATQPSGLSIFPAGQLPILGDSLPTGYEILLFFGYLIFTGVVGRCLLSTVWVAAPDYRKLEPFYSLVSFVFGYLTVTGVNRLVTLVVPNQIAPWLIMFSLSCISVVIVWSNMRTFLSIRRPSWQRISIFVFSAGCLISFFLIFQVTWPAGDSTAFSFSFLRNSDFGLGSKSYFPLMGQHYDEIMFLYPILFSDRNFVSADSIIYWWILLGVGKTACFSAVVLTASVLLKSIRYGIVLACFLFFGAIFLSPFDSPGVRALDWSRSA